MAVTISLFGALAHSAAPPSRPVKVNERNYADDDREWPERREKVTPHVGTYKPCADLIRRWTVANGATGRRADQHRHKRERARHNVNARHRVKRVTVTTLPANPRCAGRLKSRRSQMTPYKRYTHYGRQPHAGTPELRDLPREARNRTSGG